jgi:DNA-binding NtrC family response regulator
MAFMKTIWIVDTSGRTREVCRQALAAEAYRLETIADVETHLKDLSPHRPDLILLSAASRGPGQVWDMLLDIKMQHPSLPVVLLFGQDRFRFDERLSQADGYVINDCFVHEDLKRITARVLRQEATA